MSYAPFNYDQIGLAENCYIPSMVKNRNNATYKFWERALFQRAISVLEIGLPEHWQGSVKDFFNYCLYKFGFVGVADEPKFGTFFQPGTLNAFNFYYQPVEFIVSNPMLQKTYIIGEDCELIKLTPDFMGIWDIIGYYAEKLSVLDNAINVSLINNKFAFLLASKNKASGQALKKILDKINAGEPAVIYDQKLVNDSTDKTEPWQFLERSNLKQSYLTTDQLNDFNTLLRMFDTEIGIPTLDAKKERMVTSEAETKIVDSTARCDIWYNTLTSSIKAVNEKFDLNITVKKHYDTEGGSNNGEVDTNRVQ